MRQYYAYILSSHSHRLYVGVTNDLRRRVWEHLHGLSAFSSKYKMNRLVYYEIFNHPMSAIRREKALKRLLRHQKIELVEKTNPFWIDLAAGWFDNADKPGPSH